MHGDDGHFEFSNPTTARILHHSSKIRSTHTSTAASSTSLAPAVPDGVQQKSEKRTMALSAKLRAAATDPNLNPIQALMDEAEEWARDVGSQESPLTQSRRIKILSDWESIMTLADPSLSREHHWDRNVVQKYADRFLYVMVKTTDPRANKKALKSRTVSGWLGLFLHSIVSYTRDPSTHVKCGLTLLINDGLYQKLKDQLLQLVKDFKLDRHLTPKIYFGRAELAIIFDTMLRSSVDHGRQVTIQNMIRFLFTFFFTLRGSSMGPSHRMWRDLNYVLLCGHIRIFCLGYMKWEFQIRVLQYKNNYNTVEGSEQVFTADGVLYAHNALFDLTPYMMAHLHLRDLFKKHYVSIEDLCADQSGEIELDPKYAETPFFLAATPGGRGFVSPPVAAMAASGSDTLRYWAAKSGLPQAGLGGLRREAGNMYVLQLGTRIAKDIMNHAPDGPHRESYSRNMGNLPLIGLRLGEIAGTEEGNVVGLRMKESDKRHAFMGPAVECLLRRSQVEPETPDEMKLRRREEKEADDPKLRPLRLAEEAAWNVYLNCFNATARGYTMMKAKHVLNLATGKVEKRNADVIPVAFVSDWNETTTQPLLDAFLKAHDSCMKMQRSLVRRKKEDGKNRKNQDLLDGPLTGSAEQRNEILAILAENKTDEHVLQAIADAKAPETTEPASMKQWAVKLSKAYLTASVLQQPLDNDPEDDANQDRIFNYLDRRTQSQSVPATAIKANAPTDDDQDETSFQRPPIIEGEEVDVLQLPIADIRRAVLEYLVQPVLAAREYAQYLISEEEGDAHSVAAVRKHAISNFCSAAAQHRALQKTHEISAPPTTKYTEYKNTRTARSNAANGRGKNANTNESESDEEEAQRGTGGLVDRVREAEWIIQAAAEGDNNNKLVAQVLVDYLKTVGEVELTGGRKLADWDSLGLDGL
ncbi:hypothetical protein B0H13DRAFT_2310863 [Mycena leptocephala]|nr:hypothetical protein B0H13DRAFT_2310863 [Mycena leptocephala]